MRETLSLVRDPNRSYDKQIRCVDVYQRDGVYGLEEATIRILEPVLRLKGIEFGLISSSSGRFDLNIYGPQRNRSVGKRLAQSNVYLQDPSTVRPGLSYRNAQRTKYPGFMLDNRYIAHNLWDDASERRDIQSWSTADVKGMRKGERQPSRKFHQFKRLPAEIRYMITANLTSHDMFNFLRSHKAAQHDISSARRVNKTVWDRWFGHYRWLDKMFNQGCQPALIGNPNRSKDHKNIHFALVLVGQREPMDWARDSAELIESLKWQRVNEYAVTAPRESLHIGQPFGKTQLQKHPNIHDSLRLSAFHTNRQISVLKRRGKVVKEWNAHTFMLYYEPARCEPHPGTGWHVTTAEIQTFSDSFRVHDAKQPMYKWFFEGR